MKWGVSVETVPADIYGKKLHGPKFQNNMDERAVQRAPLVDAMKVQTSNFGFIYDERNVNIANDLLEGFQKAKGQLGIRLDGSIDDIQYVEVPDENELKREGVNVRDGGKYIHCIRNELLDKNGKPTDPNLKFVLVLISRETDKKKVKAFLDSVGIISQFLVDRNMKSKT